MRRERIHAALAQLPPDQKQAIQLAYFGGLTQSQIAETLQQPLGTIKTRVRLAMQKLQGFLRDEQNNEDKSVEAQRAYNISKEE
jgi:RNA polymerase sigma-70 factor (ECF subfamily)